SPRVISTNRYPAAASRPVPSTTRARSRTAAAPATPHRIFFFIVVLPTVGFAGWTRSAALHAGGTRRTSEKPRSCKDFRRAEAPWRLWNPQESADSADGVESGARGFGGAMWAGKPG